MSEILLYLIAAIIVGCLVGCKNTKETVIDEHREHLEYVKVDSATIDSIVRYNVEKRLSTVTWLNGEYTKVYYTMPDSMGRQYIDKEEKLTFNSRKETTEDIVDSSVVEVSRDEGSSVNEVKEDDNLNYKHETNDYNSVKSVIVDLIILLFIVLVFLFFIRYVLRKSE